MADRAFRHPVQMDSRELTAWSERRAPLTRSARLHSHRNPQPLPKLVSIKGGSPTIVLSLCLTPPHSTSFQPF